MPKVAAKKKPAAKKAAQVTPEPVQIVAYKGFDNALKCRGFQYEVGKTYTHNGPVEACSSGFHACENPFDVWGYYGLGESRFARVTLSGSISRDSSDSKVAGGQISIEAELKLPDFIRAGIAYLMNLAKGEPCERVVASSGDSARIGSSGDSAQIGSSGDYARIGSSGDYARIGSSGYYARIGSSGDYARIGSSGDYARIGSSGYYAQIGSSGDSARIGSSGDSARIVAEGKSATVAAAGSVSEFRVAEGGCVAIPYHDGKRTRFAVGYVGENLKAGVRYTVNGKGEFVEVQP